MLLYMVYVLICVPLMYGCRCFGLLELHNESYRMYVHHHFDLLRISRRNYDSNLQNLIEDHTKIGQAHKT